MPKKYSIKLDIPKPCHEGWENMTPNEKGRHCANCNKTVIDFSLYSDRELVEFFRKTTGNVCGHIPAYQLNRQLVLTEQRKFPFLYNLFFGTALASWLGIAGTANAQTSTPNKTEQVSSKDSNKTLADSTSYISGSIVNHSTDKPPLHGAVDIMYTERVLVDHKSYEYNIKEYEEQEQYLSLEFNTDSSGNFKIDVPKKLQGKAILLSVFIDGYKFYQVSFTLNKLPLTNMSVELFPMPINVEGEALDIRGRRTEYIVDGFICTVKKEEKPDTNVIRGPVMDNALPFVPAQYEGDGGLPLPKIASKTSR